MLIKVQVEVFNTEFKRSGWSPPKSVPTPIPATKSAVCDAHGDDHNVFWTPRVSHKKDSNPPVSLRRRSAGPTFISSTQASAIQLKPSIRAGDASSHVLTQFMVAKRPHSNCQPLFNSNFSFNSSTHPNLSPSGHLWSVPICGWFASEFLGEPDTELSSVTGCRTGVPRSFRKP